MHSTINLTATPSNSDTRPSITANDQFLTSLDCLEDAAIDMARYSCSAAGTVEEAVLQPQADKRWDEARTEFYGLLDCLLTEARQEGAASVIKALQGR